MPPQQAPTILSFHILTELLTVKAQLAQLQAKVFHTSFQQPLQQAVPVQQIDPVILRQ